MIPGSARDPVRNVEGITATVPLQLVFGFGMIRPIRPPGNHSDRKQDDVRTGFQSGERVTDLPAWFKLSQQFPQRA